VSEALRRELLGAGAAQVGFASLRGVLSPELSHLRNAVCVGVDSRLREETLSLLLALQKRAARFLRKERHRFFPIPPDSDRVRDRFASRLYPLMTHKMAATCSGMGWIGRNGLLISPTVGPRISLATVLTDAPLKADRPVEKSLCGDCTLCVEHCPSGAITGAEWSREEPFPELLLAKRCTAHKEGARSVSGRPNCGLCITICPYGRDRGAPQGTAKPARALRPLRAKKISRL
jgi:epoxyqueuosine reductase